jgi:hypothetical protein
VGQQVALALEPVERQDLVARRIAQLADPFLEQRRGRELAQLVEVLGDIGRAHDAELFHIGREPSAVDHDGDAAAGARLLQHVLVGAELRARKQPNLELLSCALLDARLEGLEALEQRIVDRERGIDVEGPVGRLDRRREGGRERDRGQRNKTSLPHHVGHVVILPSTATSVVDFRTRLR